MTDERKKDLGYKLKKIVEELSDIATEADVNIDLYVAHYDTGNYNCAHIFFYGDTKGDAKNGGRMVAIKCSDTEKSELANAFFIERDDTVRE